MAAIEIQNFSKSYGAISAVKHLTLTIDTGELFGLIGPDGAGKTTTMRTLCTLLRPDDGTLLVDGRDAGSDIAHIRSVVGYMPQRFSLYGDLTVEQNLDFFAGLFTVSRAEKEERLARLYQFSKLGPFRKRLASALSGGMKQKLALSCTLIHTPKILVLDEPTTGVDPVSRQEFWEILAQLRQQGVTILVSTPYMDEATMCDRVAFMHQGSCLALDQPDKLRQTYPYRLYEVSGENIRELAHALRAQTMVQSVESFGDRLHLSSTAAIDPGAVEKLRREFPRVETVREIEPSIEDLFLHLMRLEEMQN